MTTLYLALAHLVAASALPDSVAVMLSRPPAIPRTMAVDLADRIAIALASNGVPVSLSVAQAGRKLESFEVRNSTECAGRRDCLAHIARFLKLKALIGVDVGEVEGLMAVHVEAVAAPDARLLAQRDFVLSKRNLKGELEAEVRRFAQALSPALAEVRPSDVPKATASEPVAAASAAPVPAAPAAAVPAAAPSVSRSFWSTTLEKVPRRPLGYGFAGGAVAAAGFAVGLGLAGSAQAKRLDARTTTSGGSTAIPLTYDQARNIAGTANAEYTASAVFGAVAVVLLAGTAALFWPDLSGKPPTSASP